MPGVLIAIWSRWRSDKRWWWLVVALTYVVVVESVGWKILAWEIEYLKEAW